MSANSTLLAIQCGAGVPVPRCHLRANLVSRTQKTTIMAANPAVQHEGAGSLALVSTPSQLHRNLVTKRDKTITAAYPLNIQYQTDIPESTVVTIENFSGEVLELDDKDIWGGSRSTVFPSEIPDQGVGEFTHEADTILRTQTIGSVGALEYVVGQGKKWIVAWSNSENELNKVYTQILREGEVVAWDEIQNSLDKSGPECVDKKDPLLSEIVIDPTSAKPTVKAILKCVLPVDGKPE